MADSLSDGSLERRSFPVTGGVVQKINNGGEEITVKETGGEKKGVKNQVECRSADAGHGHNGWNSR